MPFIIGFIFLYTVPFVTSIVYAFSDVGITNLGIDLTFVGLDNFIFATTVEPRFLRYLLESLWALAYQLPIILMFSLFIAMILKQKFIGRTVFRSIFFLPVIVATGVIINIMTGDIYAGLSQGTQPDAGAGFLQNIMILEVLRMYGFSDDIIIGFIGILNSIFEMIWRSGVQILLFLAGLQSISPSLYEASTVEGSTKWEDFWFITFPLITPVLLVNSVYTIVDAFTDYSNSYMRMVFGYANRLQYGTSMAMAWMYFVIILAVIAVLYRVLSRREIY